MTGQLMLKRFLNWLNEVNVSVYLAQAMTGKNCRQIVELDTKVTKIFKKRGIRVNSPVAVEGVKASNKPLGVISSDDLLVKWKEDKRMIRRSNILVDIAAWSSSEGVKFEIGFSRYAMFMPVVRIHPTLGVSVGRFESAEICSTFEEAADIIVGKYGTRWKRIQWRFRERIFTKWIKLIYYQATGLFK